MPKFSETSLEILRARGLQIDLYTEEERGPDGGIVSIDSGFPRILFFAGFKEDHWYVAHHFQGREFEHSWNTETEAVEDILSIFFGKKLSRRQEKRMESQGLRLRHYSERHSIKNGMMIIKPVGVKGNCIEGSDCGFDTDAPTLYLQFNGTASQWNVFCVELSYGGRGPGHFDHLWATEAEAVDDVLDYFFGESDRMREIAEYRRRIAARQGAT